MCIIDYFYIEIQYNNNNKNLGGSFIYPVLHIDISFPFDMFIFFK